MAVLNTGNNHIDYGPLASLTLVMPTTDSDGNALISGIDVSISFGDAITTLTLTGSFRSTVPASASAGQVLNYSYSTNTNSWWNA
jgi:hypothetical protein